MCAEVGAVLTFFNPGEEDKGVTLTWCGVDESNMGKAKDGSKSDVCIVGIPYDGGRSAAGGQDEAPFAIRRLETLESWRDVKLGNLNTVKVVDIGDLDVDPRAAALTLRANEEVIRAAWNQTGLLLSLGGDHSITPWLLGVYSGNHEAPIVIHMDAHTDTWPYEDALGTGMPTHDSWVSWASEEGLYRHIFQVGLRALGPDNDEQIVERTTHRGEWTHRNIYGIHKWINKMYPDRSVYLSIDMDVVDPAFCPGVAYPEPGGWMPHMLLTAIEELVENLPVIGVDIVEITPSLDRGDLSVRLAHRSVLAVVRGLKAKRTTEG